MMDSSGNHRRPKTNKCNTLGKASIATLLFGLLLLIIGATLLIMALSPGHHQAAKKTPTDQINSTGDQ